MEFHQCALFVNNPRLIHEFTVSSIDKYLEITSIRINLFYENCYLSNRVFVYNSDK